MATITVHVPGDGFSQHLIVSAAHCRLSSTFGEGLRTVMLLAVVICISEVLRTLLACNFVVYVFRYIQDPER
jgi:hypothetical protein